MTSPLMDGCCPRAIALGNLLHRAIESGCREWEAELGRLECLTNAERDAELRELS